MRRNICFKVLSLLLSALLAGGCATELQPTSSPESAGLSSERLKNIGVAFQVGVDTKEIPGAVVLIARRGKIGYFEAFGYRDRDAGVPMSRDTIFRIASMTKPVTSIAVMMLVEQGLLGLDAPVSGYLTEFKELKVGVERPNAAGEIELKLEPTQHEMTVRDLLRHTSGLTYGFIGTSQVKDLYKAANAADPAQSNAEMVAKLAKLPLQSQPGSAWDYSMSTDILGRLVEVVSGMELREFFAERIFKPLGMVDTGFWVSDPAKYSRVAVVQADIATGKRLAMPDTTIRQWQSGGAGLVSTAGDYARFCQMLLNGGELDGVRLVSRATVQQMTSDQLPPGIRINKAPFPVAAVGPENGHGFGLGFIVQTADGLSAFPGSVGDYSWNGAFGTLFWIDPKKQLIAIMMLQNPFQSIALSSRYWIETRKLVYQALAD